MPAGTIEIDVINGHGLKDVEFFGKSDPYALLKIGDLNQRTKTHHNGGSNPVWNQSFLFEIPHGPTQLDIFVYDEEKHGSDDAMGSVNIPLEKLFDVRQIAPSAYKVQKPNGKFEGELQIGLKFFPKVHHGVLDVHLVEACGLLDTDAIGQSDPYAVIFCHKEVQRSKVINSSLNPIWDEHFIFNIDNDVTDILIKLFDKDDLKADDPLGNVVIPLHTVFSKGSDHISKYKVSGPKGQQQGEIAVALTFSPA